MSETTQPESTTFDHFDRTWTIPTKRHLRHLVAMREAGRNRWADVNLTVAETLLGPAQFEELLKIDPDEDQLDDFVGEIGKVLGVGNAGN